MIEHLVSVDPRIALRRFGAAVLSGGLALSPAACSSVASACEETFDFDSKQQMINGRISTPEGKVDISFNTKAGDVIHLYLEHGAYNKDLTDSELARRQAKFALQETVIDVQINDSDVTLRCEGNSKPA